MIPCVESRPASAMIGRSDVLNEERGDFGLVMAGAEESYAQVWGSGIE